jgi:predicted nucleic acid-binding protein
VILVDTSVWIAHFRQDLPTLRQLLVEGDVLAHPFVIGELACGHLSKRREILTLLETLSKTTLADHTEVIQFIDYRHLAGCGLGWVDVHLLASAALDRVPLWTLDKRLAKAARSLHLNYTPN